MFGLPGCAFGPAVPGGLGSGVARFVLPGGTHTHTRRGDPDDAREFGGKAKRRAETRRFVTGEKKVNQNG